MPGRLRIGQSIDWKWHNKEKGIVQHIPSGDLYGLKSHRVQRNGLSGTFEIECYLMQKSEPTVEETCPKVDYIACSDFY